MNEPLIPLVRRAVDAVQPLVAAVTSPVRQRPTPCPDLDLGNLTAHLIGGLIGFADVAAGKPLRFDSDPDLGLVDPSVEFRAAADRVLDGFSRSGALEQTFSMPWGETTGAQLLGFELIELLVHGWDIARSLGQQPQFDEDLVAAALAGARLWVDDSTRIPQLFGPEIEVAADAPVLDQLVGFLGRSPSWVPADASHSAREMA